MTPQLTPTMVEAMQGYSLAAAVAMVSMAAGAILSQLPSRRMKREGRGLMRSAFIGAFLVAGIMSADFMISYATQLAGLPDWPSLLQRARGFYEGGLATLQVTGAYAMVFGLTLGVLDLLLRFTLIGTLLAHLVFAVAFSVLLVFAVIGVLMALGGTFLMIVAGLAAYAYVFVALGVALVSLKYLRPLAISLVVFGLALYYGVPLLLGYSSPVAVTPMEDEARAAVVLSLTNNSVPVRLVVSSGDRDIPLFFGYARMNSTILVRGVPLNSTLIANLTGRAEQGRGDVPYSFTYGRFHNETYEIRSVTFSPRSPPTVAVTPRESWSQLYRNTFVESVWYRGLLLPGPPAEEQERIRRTLAASPTLLTPLVEPGQQVDPLSFLASSLRTLLEGIKTEKDYFRMVFERGPRITIPAPSVRPLNYNVTSMALYEEGKYRTWTELGRGHPYGNPYQIERYYRHNYTVPRLEYECWLERVEERYDPITNTTERVEIYKARAVYAYGSREPLSLARYNETRIEVVSLGAWDYFGYLRFWRPSTNGSGEPPASESFVSYRIDGGSEVYPRSKELILGTSPLLLRMNVEAEREAEWPRLLGEMADEVEGNVGRQEGARRVMEEPNATITLHPDGPEFLELRIVHYRVAEREEEGRCPYMPPLMNATARITLTSPNAPAWDPYAAGYFNWTEYSRAGSYSLMPGPLPTLTGPHPMDPRALHNMYEEDPRDFHARSSAVGMRGLMPGLSGSALELLMSIIGVVAVLVAADAVSSLAGGASLSSTLLQPLLASSPVAALSRAWTLFSHNPILRRVSDAPSRGWRSLEKTLLNHARDRIEAMRMRAAAAGDRETLRRAAAVDEAYRRYRALGALSPLVSLWKATPPGWVDLALSKVGGGRFSLVGRYDAALSSTRQQLARRISALLPEEGARLGHVWSLSGEKWIRRGEAREVLSGIRGRHGAVGVLASLALRDGRNALFTSITGIPTRVSRSFAAYGLEGPMAVRTIGFEGREVLGRRVPLPTMDKAALLGTTASEAVASKRLEGGEVAGLRSHMLEADYRRGYAITREDGTRIDLSEHGRRRLSDFVPGPESGEGRVGSGGETYWRIESSRFERRDSWSGLWDAGRRGGESR